MELTPYFESRRVALRELLPGRRVPLAFGDAEAEHMATRRAAGLFDFSFMGCLKIEGPDALLTLETLQTRRLAAVPPGRIRYTLLLRDDGTVLNDATVWRVSDTKWLLFVGRREDLPAIARDAQRFSVIALQGPRSAEILRRVVDAPDLPYFAFAECAFGGTRCLLGRIGYSGEFGYEIVIDSERAVALWEALHAAGAAECGFTAANTLRIEAGHILFSNELACRVTPNELAFERLVERPAMRAREPRVRFTGLLLDGPVETGAPPDLDRVHDGHAVVTSACRSPLFERWIGLGFVSPECRYPGTRVQAGTGMRAMVVRLPFYDPMKVNSRTRSRS